jgi:hypothetical protein
MASSDLATALASSKDHQSIVLAAQVIPKHHALSNVFPLHLLSSDLRQWLKAADHNLRCILGGAQCTSQAPQANFGTRILPENVHRFFSSRQHSGSQARL